jgi:hypothetical protein
MITKLKICWAILFKCKHERVGQFIVNRLITGEDLFYTKDKNLAWKLLNKDWCKDN